jgi:D-alanyl-D-alanine carboxypeptidase
MRTTLGKITVFTVLLLTLGIGLFLIAAWSVDDAVRYVPTLQFNALDVTAVTATSLYVFDVETGQEIVSTNKDSVLPIASVTKLLSASLFYTHANLEATTSIVWSDIATDGKAGKLAYGDIYTYRELMYPLLLESSNDAATVLLRVSPTIVGDMNAYVKNIGLTNTVFEDTSGLSILNVGTAQELGLLSLNVYKEYPHIFDITKLTQFIGSNTGWRNNNPLVGEQGYRGGKHGFTYEANRTAVAFFEEKIVTGQTRVVGYVLLGSDNIKNDIDLLRALVQQNVIFE